jgi:hypothetical protein
MLVLDIGDAIELTFRSGVPSCRRFWMGRGMVVHGLDALESLV